MDRFNKTHRKIIIGTVCENRVVLPEYDEFSSKQKIDVVCPVCYKERKARWHDIKTSENTCCYRCSRAMDLHGEKFNRLTCIAIDWAKTIQSTNGQFSWICLCECGKAVSVLGNSLSRNHTQSCGCYQRDQVVRAMIGENHPRYNKSRTHRDREKDRVTPQYRAWRQAVIKENGYKCNVCDANKKLIIHHLNSYTYYPELQYETRNGVPLCRKHHDSFHIDFMGGYNAECTEDDYHNWLASRS